MQHGRLAGFKVFMTHKMKITYFHTISTFLHCVISEFEHLDISKGSCLKNTEVLKLYNLEINVNKTFMPVEIYASLICITLALCQQCNCHEMKPVETERCKIIK